MEFVAVRAWIGLADRHGLAAAGLARARLVAAGLDRARLGVWSPLAAALAGRHGLAAAGLAWARLGSLLAWARLGSLLVAALSAAAAVWEWVGQAAGRGLAAALLASASTTVHAGTG